MRRGPSRPSGRTSPPLREKYYFLPSGSYISVSTLFPSSTPAAGFPPSRELRALHPVRRCPAPSPVRHEGRLPKCPQTSEGRGADRPGPSFQPRPRSRAPTVSVSPRSMAELMAGASLLALRSISSMTPCTSGPDRLWNSIAAGLAGPGARLLRGRVCPPPQLPGAPSANGPGASPPRPRPRPSSAAPPGRAPGPGRPRARTPPAEARGQLHRGAPGRRRQSQGHEGTGRGEVRGWETRVEVGALRGRLHAAGIACPASAPRAQSRNANSARGGDGCGRGSPGSG